MGPKRLGPPATASASANHLLFCYRDSRLERDNLFVGFSNGVVVEVDQEIERAASPWPIPRGGPYIGQKAEEFLNRFETPSPPLPRGEAAWHECSGGIRILVAQGRVIEVEDP